MEAHTMKASTHRKFFCILIIAALTFVLILGSCIVESPLNITAKAAEIVADAIPTEYTVQSGDTLLGIALRFGVTVTEIMKFNNITEPNRISKGQKLIIKKTDATSSDGSNSSDTPAAITSGAFSLDVRDADLRDVLSGLAITMNTNIILIENPVRLTFKIENVSPHEAMELILKSIEFSYVEQGNIIIAGKQDKLQKNFFDEMILTKFTLHYITATKLGSMLDGLAVPTQKIIVDENQKAIWVQGTPQALLKVKELIKSMDIAENNAIKKIPVDSATGPYALNKLYAHLSLLTQLTGMDVKYMHISENLSGDDINPYFVLWVEGTPETIKKVRDTVTLMNTP